jgi:hypothetical protein
MIVARAITKGRSFRASIKIPPNGLDCLTLPNIAASPNEPPVFRTRSMDHGKHGSWRLAVTVVTARAFGVRPRASLENSSINHGGALMTLLPCQISRNRCSLRRDMAVIARMSDQGGLRAQKHRPLTCQFAPFTVAIRDGSLTSTPAVGCAQKVGIPRRFGQRCKTDSKRAFLFGPGTEGILG